MSAIRTLTPNPALDLSARTAKVEPTHKLRCSDLQRHAGGGGINVARMLRRLGVDVRAHYLAGGVAGAQLTALLAQEGVPAQCQPIAGETRENLSVLDKASGQEFRFVMPGPQLAQQEWQTCLSAMASLHPAPQWLVASGSLPPGAPDDFYARLARQAQNAGVALALDTSGAALAHAMDAGVALVQRGAAHMVALSLGAEGAVLATAHGVWQAPAVPVTAAQGTTGAGDCFLGGLLAALVRGKTPPEALRWATAAGAASLLASGTALASAADVGKLLDQVMVSPVAAI